MHRKPLVRSDDYVSGCRTDSDTATVPSRLDKQDQIEDSVPPRKFFRNYSATREVKDAVESTDELFRFGQMDLRQLAEK